MRGQPYHHCMFDATFLREARTAPRYRIYSVGDWHPGMYAVEHGGVAVAGEVYLVSDETWPKIEGTEPPNLYRGRVHLEDGREVYGILYPRALLEGVQRDISAFGGWRAYRASKAERRERGVAVVEAAPYPLHLDLAHTALLIIDMQRDFLEAGGFGETLGNDISVLRRVVTPARRILGWARTQGLLVIHTREGHRPDLTDCPPAKRARGHPPLRIGDMGPMGRILIRGETGHDFIPELQALPDEPVIDKPGKGAFYATDLDLLLRNCAIRQLVVMGVTTEVCVQTTVREANDRGYECLVISDCVGSYFPRFHEASLEMISAQDGIVGWVADAAALLRAASSAEATVQALGTPPAAAHM